MLRDKNKNIHSTKKVRKLKEKNSYNEISGIIAKKSKNIFGKYYIEVSDGIEKVKVELGRALFDIYNENDEITIGYMNGKLINIRNGICEATEIDVDVSKTKQYYDNLSYDNLCKCGWCVLYYSKAKQKYPDVAGWLESQGIDINKPFEAMSIDPDDNGVVEYIAVQYIVFGKYGIDYNTSVGDVSVRIAQSYPDPGVEGDYFVLEIGPMKLETD